MVFLLKSTFIEVRLSGSAYLYIEITMLDGKAVNAIFNDTKSSQVFDDCKKMNNMELRKNK